MRLLEELRREGLLPALCVLVLGYLLLSIAFHRASPPLEMSDEAGHMQHILRIKFDHRLPVATLADRNAIGLQELAQPPLYYLLGAQMIRLIDTSNWMDFFHFRSSAPVGRADLPGPMNMFYPDGNRHYQQTMLAIAVLRGFSALLGLGTVVLTFLTARELFPGVRNAPFFASMLIAFNPMFLAVANSVNNDNLVSCMVAAGLLLVVHVAKNTFRPLNYVWLGIIASLAFLAKISGLIFVPIVIFQIVQTRQILRDKIAAAGLFAAVMAVLSSWWIISNLKRYGEPLALAIQGAIANNARAQTDLLALFRPLEFSGFYKSYWGVFGAFNVIYPDGVYFFFLALSAILVVLSIAYCVKNITRMPAGLNLLFVLALINLAALAWWTSHLMGSQGRLLFPSISAISICWAAGLQMLPQTAQRWIVPALAVTLFSLCAYGALIVIPAAYM